MRYTNQLEIMVRERRRDIAREVERDRLLRQATTGRAADRAARRASWHFCPSAARLQTAPAPVPQSPPFP